jgi:HEAT repeat protein
MKLKILRLLIAPWFVFYLLIVAFILFGESQVSAFSQADLVTKVLLGTLVLFCIYLNFLAVSKAGIWIADSIPSSIRKNQWIWLMQASLAVVVVAGLYLLGATPKMPLFWQGILLPLAYTLCLFFIFRCLVGVILIWASKMTFIRVFSLIFSVPIFLTVIPVADYVGSHALRSYILSQPNYVSGRGAQLPAINQNGSDNEVSLNHEPEAQSELAKSFKQAVEAQKPCDSLNKEINAQLSANSPEDVVYWAVRAIKCSDLKSVQVLPKLAKLMGEHKSSEVRAAAIRALPKYGVEGGKRVAYLLVKRLSADESPEVMDAAVSVLSYLGEENVTTATSRLKKLLEDPKASEKAAKILVDNLKNLEPVVEYVTNNLLESSSSKTLAVAMVCVLPKNVRSKVVLPSNVEVLLSSLQSNETSGAATRALECLDEAGFLAVLNELRSPRVLQKSTAAQAVASIKSLKPEETLQVVSDCVVDSQVEVRTWCAQALGKLGSPAVSKILQMLESEKQLLRDAGVEALKFVEDPSAKPELLKLRAQNSGWMANKSNLFVAQAIDQALSRMETKK